MEQDKMDGPVICDQNMEKVAGGASGIAAMEKRREYEALLRSYGLSEAEIKKELKKLQNRKYMPY